MTLFTHRNPEMQLDKEHTALVLVVCGGMTEMGIKLRDRKTRALSTSFEIT